MEVGQQFQPEGQFRDSACAPQIWPLEGTEDGSEANSLQLPKFSFHSLTLIQLNPWARS